ncbi:MAG: hypothetical protein O7G85_16870 [Planctomycetota bacterium]|nr:hypothetical protein [Planctomycetota bacterium]
MGVDYSRHRLQQTLKELMLRWEKANTDWDDQVSRDFKTMYLDPLAPRIKTTMESMENMSVLLKKMKRDCG